MVSGPTSPSTASFTIGPPSAASCPFSAAWMAFTSSGRLRPPRPTEPWMLTPPAGAGKAGAADNSLAPVTIGYINEQGDANPPGALASTGAQMEFKLYTMDKGARAILERTYPGGSEMRASTHRWCNEVVKLLSGDDGVFGTQIALVGGRIDNKNVYVMDFDGYGLRRLTNGKLNILPSWGPGGGGLLFTTYAHLNPDLYFVGLGGGRPRKISSYPGLNTGGVYSPDGSKIGFSEEVTATNAVNAIIIPARAGSPIRAATGAGFKSAVIGWPDRQGCPPFQARTLRSSTNV